jgi:hypothetical protein
MSNYEEFIAGTDPTDRESYLRIDILEGVADGGAVLNFMAVSNRTYNLLSRDVVGTGSWSQLTTISASPTNHSVVWTNLVPGAATKYYRLEIPVSP